MHNNQSRSLGIRDLLWILSWSIILMMSCNDSEPDFISGDCNEHTDDGQINGIYFLYSEVTRTDLEPYYCLAYEVNGEKSVLLDIINYYGNCAGPMGGTVHVKDSSSLTLRVKRQSDCNMAAGCMCPYDMSLEVDGIATDEDLDVLVENLECDGSPGGCNDRATLPLKTQSRGLACRYGAHFDGFGGGHGDYCTGGGEDSDDKGETCNAGFTCTEVSEIWPGSGPRCIAQCSQAADCPVADLHECKEGLCQIANPLELACD